MRELVGARNISVAAVAILCACADASNIDNTSGTPSENMMVGVDAGTAPEQTLDAGTEPQVIKTDLTNLLDTIVNETCDAVYRCCNENDKIQFWNPIATHPALEEEFASQLPPRNVISAEECPVILKQIYEIRPFGSWIRAAQSNDVVYNEEAAKTCLADLRAASCGEDIIEHLFDGTCFAFLPPYGGENHRKVFTRVKKNGETCRPVADGAGGQFYGTCDPHESFCCIPNPRNNGECMISSVGEGVCRTASTVGESCGIAPQLQLCVSGLECDPGAGSCITANYNPLSIGTACYDQNNVTLLGSCVDSFCDIFGTNNCETMKEVGESCVGAEQCVSNQCEAGVCTEYSFCVMPE